MTNPAPIEKPTSEDALLKEGWTKQFLASGARLQEATDLYESTGFEVRLEPARAGDLACSECHVEQSSETIESLYVIYTRRRRGTGDPARGKEDLW